MIVMLLPWRSLKQGEKAHLNTYIKLVGVSFYFMLKKKFHVLNLPLTGKHIHATFPTTQHIVANFNAQFGKLLADGVRVHALGKPHVRRAATLMVDFRSQGQRAPSV